MREIKRKGELGKRVRGRDREIERGEVGGS